MNNKIKEILDKLKDYNYYDELDLTGDKWIELKQIETKQILDYITNLQQENERLKKDVELFKSDLISSTNTGLSLITKIDKAIEYNKEIVDNYLKEDDCEYCDGRYATAKHNLNILQNGSENDG